MGEEIPGGMAEYVRVPTENLIRLERRIRFRHRCSRADCLRHRASGCCSRLARSKSSDLVLYWGRAVGSGSLASSSPRCSVRASSQPPDPRTNARGSARLGADHTIDYSKQDFSREAWTLSGKIGVDVVVNYTGGDTWIPSLRTLKPRGKLLTCGATAGLRYQQRHAIHLGARAANSRLERLFQAEYRDGARPCLPPAG